jgi:hypothetical protein
LIIAPDAEGRSRFLNGSYTFRMVAQALTGDRWHDTQPR